MIKKVIFILLTILLLVGCEKNKLENSYKLEGPYKVVKVIDGDTITLNNSAKIRFSGINTPEVGDCYYQEAKDRLTGLLMDNDVFLERDKTDIDKYDRLLRYVYLNNEMMNSLMVREGYAKVFDKYKEDTKRYDELKKIEEPVKASKLGVWGCEEKKTDCLYVGSKNSKTYHKPDCKLAKKIKPENMVCYKNEQEVKPLEPCKKCVNF